MITLAWQHIAIFVVILVFAVPLLWYGGKAEANDEWRRKLPEIKRKAIALHEAEKQEPRNVVAFPASFGVRRDG